MASAALSVVESDPVDLLLREVRRFLAREVRSDAIDRTGAIPEAVRAGAAELGLFGLTVPESYGGAGLSLGQACRIVTEIARVDRSTAIMIGLHVGLGTRGIVEHGAEELRRTWLPRLASGECVASFCATETGAGSDLTAIATTGTVVPGGLRIDGEKSYVTNGGFAGLFTALVRTPGLGGARACSLVAIPRETPGVEIGREEEKLGIRGSSTVTVRFDGAVVPLGHVLGAPGSGSELTNRLLAWGRTLMSAGCIGNARAALEATVAHVESRRQFGRAIGAFGATRAHVAWMASRVHAMEAIVRLVHEEHAREDDIEASSAIAKVFTSESAFAVCDRAVQLHGALGFLESTGVARLLRDCRITRIFEGANDVLLVRIGAARLATRPTPSPVPCGAGGGGGKLEALARRIDGAVAEARASFGIGVVHHQLVLQRIALAEIALVVARACSEDDPIGRHAVAQLVGEGHAALDALACADEEEESAAAVTGLLYQV